MLFGDLEEYPRTRNPRPSYEPPQVVSLFGKFYETENPFLCQLHFWASFARPSCEKQRSEVLRTAEETARNRYLLAIFCKVHPAKALKLKHVSQRVRWNEWWLLFLLIWLDVRTSSAKASATLPRCKTFLTRETLITWVSANASTMLPPCKTFTREKLSTWSSANASVSFVVWDRKHIFLFLCPIPYLSLLNQKKTPLKWVCSCFLAIARNPSRFSMWTRRSSRFFQRCRSRRWQKWKGPKHECLIVFNVSRKVLLCRFASTKCFM